MKRKYLIPVVLLMCVLLLSSCGQVKSLLSAMSDRRMAFCDNYTKLDVTIAHDDGTETDMIALPSK